MKAKITLWNKLLISTCLAAACAPVISRGGMNTNVGYVQMNIVSDIATNSPHLDTRLVNPWGLIAAPDVVWINDNGPGLTTAYGPFGRSLKFAIHIPSPGDPRGGGTPSGLVFNDTHHFVITNGMRRAPSTFLMATEDGTIVAWSHSISGTNGVIVVDNSASGAVYKGLAIVRDENETPLLFAANFHARTVDVFDANFHPMFSFTDTNLPPLFAPFNVRNIRGRVFVTVAKQRLPDMHDDAAGPGNGFLDIFDTDGTLLRRFTSQGVLNSPWGMAVAPSRFGRFSHALLVGNFGDGRINAFDLLTGKLLGHLTRTNGEDLVIEGLWGLSFERDEFPDHESEFRADRLYFTAGINDEADGLAGIIRPISPFVKPAR
jgi:uncharacterized protein (TIGR03118 family)